MVSNSATYKELFCYEQGYVLHNTKYNKNIPYEVCFVSSSGTKKFERIPSDTDKEINDRSKNLKIKIQMMALGNILVF